MRLWQVGAIVSSITSLSGVAGMVLATNEEPMLGNQSAEVFKFDDYTARWGPDELFCEEYDSCVFLVIDRQGSCSLSTVVEFTITDEEDAYLGTQRLVVSDKLIGSTSPVEIGSNISDVGYFAIDNILCSSAVDSQKLSV